jgi:hypothetical protein
MKKTAGQRKKERKLRAKERVAQAQLESDQARLKAEAEQAASFAGMTLPERYMAAIFANPTDFLDKYGRPK